MQQCYYDDQLRFVLPQYGRQPTFSSFLPGIAGSWGIPTWCNYNNRGQGISSFGVQDKDHAIMEFTAASTSYQRSALEGFRTFVKIGQDSFEPFANGMGTMTVEPNCLLLHWENAMVAVNVTYFTLPNEKLPGLCRRVEVSNLSDLELHMEILDGMAKVVPYGVKDEKLKQEANLSTAWMKVDNLENNIPFSAFDPAWKILRRLRQYQVVISAWHWISREIDCLLLSSRSAFLVGIQP